jgi:rubrerythrin
MKALMDSVQTQQEHPFGELSLAFSSLAQSAARQQRPNMAKLLSALAQSYQIQALNAAQEAAPIKDRAAELAGVQAQVKTQTQAYSAPTQEATEQGERGILRALLWGNKVTMIENSLLTRLVKQGAGLFKGNQQVHVCEACGFVIVKDGAPDICPICKAPRERFVSL